MEPNVLLEKWTPLIESKKAKAVKNPEVIAQLLENQEQWQLNEASTTSLGDFAQYTPILVPAVRRIFPNLIANEVVGVQPMNGPTGYAFAIRFGYETGTAGAAKNNLYGNINYPGTAGGGTYPANPPGLDGVSRMQMPDQSFNSYAIVLKGQIATANTADGVKIDMDAGGAGAAVTMGTVVLAEYDAGQDVTKILIKSGAGGQDSITAKAALLAAIADADATITFGGATYVLGTSGTDAKVLGFFNNEAGYNLIFGTKYAPYVNTTDGEYLSRTQMKSMKMSIERFAVTAETRKYKAEYSQELAQDLKQVHGVNAEAELINIVEYEVAAELDRDLVDAIHKVSTPAGSWFYGAPGQLMAGSVASLTSGSTPQTADGRWELEKFRSLYTRIIREANAVALQTRRGAANFIIASLNVVSALETLSNFMYSAVPGNVEAQIGVAKVGTLDGRFTVYLDTFAFNDFFIVGYKGTSAMDSGVIFCPYVPLQIIKVTDPDTFQPAIGFQSRDAIMSNIWGADKYYRKVLCDFTGSSFISSTYYF